VNSKIYNIYCPNDQDKKDLFKIFSVVRCFNIGFEDFSGCKKNILKILPEFKKSFFSKKKKKNKFLFNFLLKFLSNKTTSFLDFQKNFPMANEDKIKKVLNNINDEEKYYDLVSKLVSSLNQNIDEEENISSQKSSDSKNVASEKKKKDLLKKIEFKEPPSKKKKEPGSQNDENKNSQSAVEKHSIGYKVFTKRFDVFTKAEKLLKYNELKKLREKFDEECKDNTKLINRLAKKLEKLLYSLDYSTWKFDQEEGFFDSSRFSQFIANPNNSNIFKLERKNTEKNTLVSLLLDNSGSMRGKPIVTSAITAEIITKTLEKCRVNVEILGFTTKEWKGGLSKKLWEKEKRKPNPGRLNDLLHIIYKDADTAWNHSKLNLGLVLKEGLLKENIDGEALVWASNRLKKRSERKKILIVISDGAPVDDSTLSSNNSNILDNHLKEVVSDIEKTKDIDLVAIGIGHDVSKYYSRAFTIDDVEKLGEIIIDNLTEIIREKKF
jgi:cobaltochelatase CobT